MGNNKYTFWKLLDENSIEIPIIQRDYAQGRAEESRIRDKFLDAIHKQLTNDDNDSPMNLDFVYGRIIDNKLIPLDGQQRLTTLFLLHWYLAVKDDDLAVKDDKLADEVIKKLQKFTYETRVSSREFCNALVANKIDLTKEKISEDIEDKNWFFKSWKKDPTIKSMLNMLDSIHERFKGKDSQNLFDKLICKDNPPITFDFLPLDDFNLTDELYIKMNARGKPLTEFENFKANLERQLEESGVEQTTDIKAKLDNDWQDIFWNKHKDKLNDKNSDESEVLKSIDDSYFNFFKNITLFFALNKEIKIDNLEQVDVFEYQYTQEDIRQIEIVLDSLSNEKQKSIIDEQTKIIRENLTVFDDFLKPYSKTTKDKNITYEERMRFYAFILFLIKCKDSQEEQTIDEANFKSWMRVSINLINNTTYDKFDDFRRSIDLLNELSEKNNSIYTFLKDYEIVKASDQLKEEVQKAIIIQSNINWEEEFLIAEKNWYLDGEIGFLLELSKENEQYNINTFIKYRDKFISLLGLKEGKRHLIQRALLTFTNNDKTYITETKHGNSNKYTLCTSGTGLREKNENWRRVLNTVYFKNLLDKLDDGNIENVLKKLINEFEFDCNDWRSFFINPNNEWHILDDIKNFQIQIESNEKIFLNRGNTGATSWGWSRVAELRSLYVYKAILNNPSLKDEVKYYSTSEQKDVCLYFDMKHNFKDLALDIKYNTENKNFTSKLFYRDGSDLPQDLNNFKLEFMLCDEQGNITDIAKLEIKLTSLTNLMK